MKNLILAASLLASAMTMAPSAMATDVGVSISVGDPNFYGRIDIGNVPQPRLIYAQPVVIERSVQYVDAQPVYLRVPPGHAKKWSKHCGKYNACGQRVYFVQDSWYTNEYAPRYRQQQGYSDGHKGKGNSGNHGKSDKHGNGNGKGKGKD